MTTIRTCTARISILVFTCLSFACTREEPASTPAGTDGLEESVSRMAAISTIEYGDPVKEAELLKRLSPIHKVDKVTAPTIVLHSANDTNVPVVEAEQVVASLEERGVPVKYVLFPDEGHGWRKTRNRVTSDVEIVKWFDEHLQ